MLDTTFSRLVGGVYDAVIDPGLWTEAVDAIRREFRFELAVMGVQKLPSGEAVLSVSVNIPAAYLASIANYGPETLEIWGGSPVVANAAVDEPLVLSRHLPVNWRENRFYVEWWKPLGLVDQVAIALANDRRTTAFIGFAVHETRQPIEAETIGDLRLLAPHLRRAVQISRLLDMTTNNAATFETALSAMVSGAVLVEADMRIVYANPVAQRMLRDGDAIRSNGGRLDLVTAVVPGQLELAVQAAAGPEDQLGQQGVGIPTRGQDGAPLVLHVLPLEQRSPRTGAPWKSVAAVFIADTGGEAAVPMDALSVLFQLTPTERRVLELTVAGRSSREVAEALDVAPSTVKTHMLNLFDKTGRHRREDLIKLASEVSLPT